MFRWLSVCIPLSVAVLARSQDAAQAPIFVPADSAPVQLVRKIAPLYPPLARQARISGQVLLSVVIDRYGGVRETKLVSGHPMLAPAAIDAVKQWRYRSFMFKDQAIEVATIVRVNFRLAGSPDVSAPRAGNPELTQVPAALMQGLLERKVDPECPEEATGMAGTVVMKTDIDMDGTVARVELVSGESMLAQAAMDAVLQWKYRLFELNGQALPVETTVEMKCAMGKVEE